MPERKPPAKVVQLGGPDRIAADWIARLDAHPSEENRAAFERWKAESDANREAADRLDGLWSELDALREFRPMAEPGLAALRARRPATRRRRQVIWAAAAAAVAAAAVPALWMALGPGRLETYATPVGKQRTINLADGSTVQLNTNSEVEVRLRRHARDLVLTHGEAFFEVAPDPSRPFTVYTREGSVRAVGTAFAVRVEPGALRVTLTKGTVRLQRPQRTGQPLPAGDILTARSGNHPEATITPRAIRRETVSSQEVARQLSWRQGVLVFNGERLPEVVEDIGRYTDVQIEIADPRLRELKVGGYFDAGDVPAMLEALQSSFDVRVEWLDPKHVRLSSAKG